MSDSNEAAGRSPDSERLGDHGSRRPACPIVKQGGYDGRGVARGASPTSEGDNGRQGFRRLGPDPDEAQSEGDLQVPGHLIDLLEPSSLSDTPETEAPCAL